MSRTDNRELEQSGEVTELLKWVGAENSPSFENWLSEYQDLLARVVRESDKGSCNRS